MGRRAKGVSDGHVRVSSKNVSVTRNVEAVGKFIGLDAQGGVSKVSMTTFTEQPAFSAIFLLAVTARSYLGDGLRLLAAYIGGRGPRWFYRYRTRRIRIRSPLLSLSDLLKNV